MSINKVPADTLLKIFGVVLTIVGQTFAIYTAVDRKIAELSDRIVNIEKAEINLQNGIDRVRDQQNKLENVDARVSELEIQSQENFRRILSLENK